MSTTTLPAEVAELLSVRSLAIRDLDPALVTSGTNLIEFMDTNSAPIGALVAAGAGHDPCSRALRFLLRLRPHVVLGRTSWEEIRAYLEEQIERAEVS